MGSNLNDSRNVKILLQTSLSERYRNFMTSLILDTLISPNTKFNYVELSVPEMLILEAGNFWPLGGNKN
jgi:hypothetical protein